MTTYKLGWKPQKPDHRDLKYFPLRLAPIQSVYLSDKYRMPLPYDQGNLGSCVANGVNFAVHFDLLNNNLQSASPIFLPSRLYTYYYGRVIEGTVSVDSGLEVRDGIKVINAQGAPSEDAWVYDITKFAVAPPAWVDTLAHKLQSVTYASVDNTNKQLIINALLSGLPIVFGMTVYNSFLSDQVAISGIIPYPQMSERVAGGHCMAIVGYHAIDDSFIVRNSWGTTWGQKGYCRIPASYLTNSDLATDFWVISKMN